MKYPLGRPFPIGRVATHLHQLAREGQGVCIDAEVRAQLGAELKTVARDVRGMGLEAAQLGVYGIGFLLELALGDLHFDLIVLGVGLLMLDARRDGNGPHPWPRRIAGPS